jgi:hypothetical protein
MEGHNSLNRLKKSAKKLFNEEPATLLTEMNLILSRELFFLHRRNVFKGKVS